MAKNDITTGIPVSGAATETAKIQRVQVNVPAPFKEGHSLRSNEAQALNEQYTSAIRNGVSGKIKEKLQADGAMDTDGNLTDRSKIDTKAVQAIVDEYTRHYDFGQVRSGGDPVEKEAKAIARNLVEDAIQRKGGKVSQFSAKQITQKANELLQDTDKGPKIRAKAKQVVESRSELSDIDI